VIRTPAGRNRALVLAVAAFDVAVVALLGLIPLAWMAVAGLLAGFAWQTWRRSELVRLDGRGVRLRGHGSRAWSEIREIGFREGALVVRPHGSLQAPAVVLEGPPVNRERVAAVAAANGVRTADGPSGCARAPRRGRRGGRR
jgi:hypothetical protein